MTSVLAENLVDGSFVGAVSGARINVLDPATQRTVGTVPAMTSVDLDRVFEAATRGAAVWRRTDRLARGRVLLSAAQLIRRDADELTELIVSEMGKTRAEARGEVGKAAEFFEFYGGLGRLPYGELLADARPGTFVNRILEPLGVVVLVTPWNDPLLTPARKLAPALISGNAVVIKPATDAPIITLRLAGLLHEAGLPAGVLGTVTGRGGDIGDGLVQRPEVRAVSFTGSTSVGLELQRKLAGTGVRVQTEMGGKNAAVVLEDADLESAAAIIIAGAFGQAGQRCTATSRLIVQRGIASRLSERLAEHVQGLTIGAGGNDGVTMGPVISRKAQQDITAFVDRAVSGGAQILAKARVDPALLEQGSFVEPVLLSVATTAEMWREEVFGPVLSMTVVDDLDEAIALVNDSPYGLSSAVFTTRLDAAFAFVEGVDTGQVSVNQPTSGWDVHQPFGGFKASGSPFKEQGLDALGFYSRVKTAAIRVR